MELGNIQAYKKRKRIPVGTVYSGRLRRGKKQLVNFGSDGQLFIKQN